MEEFHNAVTDKHVCRAKHSTMNDPISGFGTMYRKPSTRFSCSRRRLHICRYSRDCFGRVFIFQRKRHASAFDSNRRNRFATTPAPSASPDLVWNRKINPGMVFVLTLPLDPVAKDYRAMDERRAIKTLLRP